MDPDLAEIIEAWNETAHNLTRTHEILKDEVRQLTAELETKNRELARKNRLADLGQMASHIAHEVRNGLVPITVYLALLKRKLACDKHGLEILEKLDCAFGELDVTVNDLLHFTSDRKPNKSQVRVDELIENVCNSILPQFESQSIHVYADLEENLVVSADKDMLRRAVLNMLLNGIDAMPSGGELIVKAKRFSSGDDTTGVEITIIDTGCGFSHEALKHATEPFFSTKSTGTGLGLAIVCRIAEVHEGALQIGNSPKGGAILRMTLCT